MTIVEFLLERLEQDQVNATMRAWHDEDCETIPRDGGYTYPCDCGVPERMAADVAAKRRIIEVAQQMLSASVPLPNQPAGENEIMRAVAMSAQTILLLLAEPYSSHPEYDPAWSVA